MSPQTGAELPGRTLIAVCTLREADNVEAMLRQLRRRHPAADVLIVDDDSDDQTAAIAQRFADSNDHAGKIDVMIRRDQPGLGYAIAATMNAAVQGGYEYLVNLDADFSHDPADIAALFAEAKRTQSDVVIGSRYVDGGRIRGWPLHRRLMSRMVNRLATWRMGLPVADCSGSMRCYRVAGLASIDPGSLTSPGYSVLEEVLMRLHQDGATMCEVPITFTDRRDGQSKLTVREAIRSLMRIWTLGQTGPR